MRPVTLQALAESEAAATASMEDSYVTPRSSSLDSWSMESLLTISSAASSGRGLLGPIAQASRPGFGSLATDVVALAAPL